MITDLTPARELDAGMGVAVARRSVLRKLDADEAVKSQRVQARIKPRPGQLLDEAVGEWAVNMNYSVYDWKKIGEFGQYDTVVATILNQGDTENWADVADRVAMGNAGLIEKDFHFELNNLAHHIRQASVLMSGRHLQHGDIGQADRPMEVFTNCSSAAMSFALFYLLLNGSGVGRAYDDDMMVVDWSQMPIVVPTIDMFHKDCGTGEIRAMTKRDATHLYKGSEIEFFDVEDSREGWAHAVAFVETLAFEKKRDTVVIMDFSDVRPRGAPIGGMQDRPASGPGPIMEALNKVSLVRNTTMPIWKQALYVDHFLAECVLVGGARRAARMATKNWRDPGAIEFARVKRAIELEGLHGMEIKDEIEHHLSEHGAKPNTFLWSSNNSITVDQDFWRYVQEGCFDGDETMYLHATNLMATVAECSYYDGTGEPGLINQDKLVGHDDMFDEGLFADGRFADSKRFKIADRTLGLTKALVEAFKRCEYKMICNPCGEIALIKLGGYCVIADVVPYHAANDEDAEDAFRAATRALIRANTMDCFYRPEVDRTNRIGVSITGFHEWVWKRFGFGWKEIVNELKSREMWLMLSRFKRAIVQEAAEYSEQLGVNAPLTDTTFKPAGSTSKLFGLSEGAHLPSMAEYIRWVQFHNTDPRLEEYKAKGYRWQELRTYRDHTVVGFPTEPEICRLGMGDRLVTAAEATPEEQYEYLRLLEKYWIVGVADDGVTPLSDTGNQISYTLKYDPSVTSFDEFLFTLIEGQSSIRCCSVMPQEEVVAYEYQPEQPVSREDFAGYVKQLELAAGGHAVEEDVGIEHVDCSTGACPIAWGENSASSS